MRPFVIAVALALIAGFVDAAGYLVFARVFFSHMSGNTVAAAAHLGAGENSQIFRRAFPIPMFVAGVFIGALLDRAVQERGWRRRFAPAFILEMILLGTFIAFTHGNIAPTSMPATHMYLLIALLALAMGLQNATLRCARGIEVRTTFISGMLVSMAEKAATYVARSVVQFRKRQRGQRPDTASENRRLAVGRQALRFAALWCGMFFGAALGAFLETRWGTLAMAVPLAGLASILFLDLLQPISKL